MTHYIITGTSSGIGKALADRVLKESRTFVTGISRRKVIDHERYEHFELDLNTTGEVMRFSLPSKKGASKVVLVNNAGYLGDIKRYGSADNEAIARVFNVNVTAAAVLMNKFLNADYAPGCEKTVLNVSSGAGQYEIPSWASYCGSKAAVDHLSRTVKKEMEEIGSDAVILSVGPGVVDTEMQGEIRSSSPEDFSRHGDFVEFKEKGELASPQLIAEKYLYVLESGCFNDSVVGSLREVELDK